MNPECRGLGVALATPFLPDGDVDSPALARLVHHVFDGGADFVVALGSTGEAAMLTEAERDAVVATVRDHANGRPVLVGTGAAATAQTIAWTRRAQQLGADGALVVVPPYTRPTQAGLLAHFAAVAEATPSLPLWLYNVPGRTATNLLPATLAALWRLPNVVGIKESSGDLQQIGRIAAELPPGKFLLAGDDALALATIAVGGHGLVSVAGNVVPGAMRELVAAALGGDLATARRCHAALLPLFEALAAEPNPIPVKSALALCGFAEPAMRLPLLPATAATVARLRTALHQETAEARHG